MTRRKDGLWQEVLTINGKKKYFYGKTKSGVLTKLREYKEQQERGILFDVLSDKWWEEHEPLVAYTTAASYKPAKERAALWFRGVPAKEIEPQQIARHIQEFSKTHASKTVHTQLLVYHLIFKYAVVNGYCKINPARDLSAPVNLKKEKITSPSQEDINRVKASTGCTFGMFAFWALYTGMRRGELLALDWRDVDTKARTIQVNKSIYHDSNRPKLKLPKTKASISTIPILDALLQKIQIHPASGLVFPNSQGDYLTNTQFQSLWKTYCKESGIHATPHQFRHAFATMLFEADIPPEKMQLLLRHAQLSTTMDIYTDIRENKIKNIYRDVYSVDIK